MELYAKSKAKQLSIKEVEALKETLESFLDSFEGILHLKIHAESEKFFSQAPTDYLVLSGILWTEK